MCSDFNVLTNPDTFFSCSLTFPIIRLLFNDIFIGKLNIGVKNLHLLPNSEDPVPIYFFFILIIFDFNFLYYFYLCCPTVIAAVFLGDGGTQVLLDGDGQYVIFLQVLRCPRPAPCVAGSLSTQFHLTTKHRQNLDLLPGQTAFLGVGERQWEQ